jgi:nucleoside-diphosphate-sugar epimerase
MKKVLVTGGAGFIGSHLVDRLVDMGCEVFVVDDLSLGKEENLKGVRDKIKFFRKSVCDDLKEVFDEGIDCVFHVAALPRVQSSIKQPVETHEVNVNGTLNLLDACRRFDVKKFVFSSSSSVYGDQEKMPLSEKMETDPISPYALHKLIGEHYCKLFNLLYGIETVSLRYFNVFGSRMDPEGGYALLIGKFIKSFKENRQPIIYGDGEQTRDFTFIDDVVEANILAAKTDNKEVFGKAFNVGAGNNRSVNDVTKQIKLALNSSLEAKYGPSVIEPRHTLADISKIKNFLEWEPKTSFEIGLGKTVAWFEEN